jgi:methylmalonyl-CoA/ethylmalonyl-CoA epimerase
MLRRPAALRRVATGSGLRSYSSKNDGIPNISRSSDSLEVQSGLGRLRHVALAVPCIRSAGAMYRDALGAVVSNPRALSEHGVTTVFVRLPNTDIELLEPLGPKSPIAAFLAKNPAGGMHHICLEVKDMKEALDVAEAQGLRVVGGLENVKIGAHGNPVAFLHPKSTFGTMIELEEVRSREES